MKTLSRWVATGGFVATIMAWLTAPAADALISFNHNETRL